MKRIINNVYNYKAEMMGVAIIMIMAFHTILPAGTSEAVLSIKRYGEVGVDVFLFIGGLTVAGSLMRSTGLAQFYKKRLIRILPAYLLIWGGVHLVFSIRYSSGLVSYIENVSLWNCVVHNDLRNWYVAAVLSMYMVTPLYMWLCRKSCFFMATPLLLVLCGCALMWKGDFKSLYMFMFWLRLPIYMIGVNFYMLKDKDWKLNPFGLTALAIVSIAGAQLVLQCNISGAPYELRRYFYIPIVLCFVGLWRYKSYVLAFIGTITLELYLLHELLQGLMYDLITPPIWIYVPVSVLGSVAIGYAVHRLLGRLIVK